MLKKKSEDNTTEGSRMDSGVDDVSVRGTDAKVKEGSKVVEDSGYNGSDVKRHDTERPEEILDGSVEDTSNLYAAVEMCLTLSTGLSSESVIALTNDQGAFEFTGPIETMFVVSIKCYFLTPRKVGVRFEPEQIEIADSPFSAEGSFYGFIQDEFVANRIETGPHATGQWELVDYECPSEEGVKACVDAGMPEVICRSKRCETMTIGTRYMFEDGCLLEQASINCVEGTQYGPGNGTCAPYSQYLGASGSSDYEGYYDQENHRWHINQRICSGFTSPETCPTGALTLERVTALIEE